MIPLRISMKGFLSYQAEQTLDLSDLPLCMLSGRNGTGKSSVFDAMTFALFGEHRNGAQHNEDLINKKSDAASVELEFQCGGSVYSIRRNVGRKADGSAKPVTGVLRRKDAAGEEWSAMPDVASTRAINTWVEQNVGLTAETFTTSTLLRQGEADRLLNATAAEKHVLLASAIGLEQYQKLHELTDDQRKKRKAAVETLEAQLQREAQVSEEQVSAAAAASHAAEAALEAAEETVGRLAPMLEQSRNWAQWSGRLSAAESKRKEHDLLLSRSAKIETDWSRLCDLRIAVASLRTIVDYRGRLETSTKKVDTAGAKRGTLEKQRAGLDVQLADLRAACAKSAGEAGVHDQRHREVEKRLAELGGMLTQAAAVERQQRDLDEKKKQRSAWPSEAAKIWDTARQEVERLTELATTLPALHAFDANRAAVAQSHSRLRQAEEGVKTLSQEVTMAAAALAELQKASETADAAHAQAQADESRTAAELEIIRKTLDELAKIDGQADCPTCGQELSADHRKKERTRRQKSEKAVAKACADAVERLKLAREEQKKARGLSVAADRRHSELQSQIKAREQNARQFGEELAGLLKKCTQSHGKLSESFRARVGAIPDRRAAAADDFAALKWPVAADLQSLDQDAAKLPAARTLLAKADADRSACQQLDMQIQVIEEALKGSGADKPVDVKPLRDEQQQLSAEQKMLQQALQSAQAEQKRQSQQVASLETQIKQAASEKNALENEIGAEKARQDGFREAITTATAALPPAWSAAAASADAAGLKVVENEQQQLETAKVEAEFKLLQSARSSVVALEQQIRVLQDDIEKLPSEARVDPGAIEAKLVEARAQQGQRRGELNKTQAEHQELKNRRQRRLELELQYQTAFRELGHYKRLAGLLGREQLQRHLMRKAEREIVQFANAVLDRISMGDLTLRLRPSSNGATGNGDATAPVVEGGPEQVLDLQAFHRKTSNDALNTAFLSGSQQFRVAVSLALAFGQYARGGKGLGECVIIDEGFGSLDKEGQQVMIDELQKLQTLMKRIILVSHQETFAEAFPHGYRFTLEEGQTRVERINM
jgi:DNA repair exonuclease SbcCD ATPase subunit